MKPIYILKIGGSVVTYKNRRNFSVRCDLLKKIAVGIKKAMGKKDFDLILIHGAGAAGHQLAKKYGLKNGTGKNKKRWRGAIFSRLVNQKLNLAISEIFVSAGLRVAPVHTASILTQKNQKIDEFNMGIVKESLKQDCVPLLYGEMVFDKKLGMTICSGDTLAPYLAEKLKAEKIFFASDVEGIFTENPYLNKKARLIEKISFGGIGKGANLSESHNIDVTGGLLGKINKLGSLQNMSVKAVEIFNGLQSKNFEKALVGETFSHTTIKM